MNDQAESDLRRAEMLSPWPALLLLLVLIFRGPVAAVLPLVIGVLSILGSFAVLRGSPSSRTYPSSRSTSSRCSGSG